MYWRSSYLILKKDSYAVFELENKYSWNAFEYRWQSRVMQHLIRPWQIKWVLKEAHLRVGAMQIFELLPSVFYGFLGKFFLIPLEGDLLMSGLVQLLLLELSRFDTFGYVKKENKAFLRSGLSSDPFPFKNDSLDKELGSLTHELTGSIRQTLRALPSLAVQGVIEPKMLKKSYRVPIQ